MFSDANTAFAPDAIRRLVRPFADPAVGGVAGNQVYLPTTAASGPTDPAGATAAGVGERSYWDLDRLLKDAESLRRERHLGDRRDLRAAAGAVPARARGVTDDFSTSTRVIAAGRRLVFEPEAIA